MPAHDRRLYAILIISIFVAVTSYAHPGASISVSAGGVVYFIDTGAGIFSIDAAGRTVRRDGPAFHWFAFDPASRFRDTPWPAIPGAEFRSAGTNPTLILSSDYPVTIGTDGKFYYPDQSQRDRVRIVGIAPSGARSTRAVLPPITRGGETIYWLNGLASGRDNSLYYSEDRAIRKIDASGRVSTVVANVNVPNCAAVPGLDKYTAPYLRGLAVAPDGNIYVAASGCGALLKIDPRGTITPVLRLPPPWSPTAVAVAGDTIYVLEYLHTASDNRAEWIPRVRRISRSGQMTMIGGSTRK